MNFFVKKILLYSFKILFHVDNQTTPFKCYFGIFSNSIKREGVWAKGTSSDSGTTMARVLRFLAVLLAVVAVVNAETFEDNADNPEEVAAESELLNLNEGLENLSDQVEYKGMKMDLFLKNFFEMIRK